jgi:hypothetical protein
MRRSYQKVPIGKLQGGYKHPVGAFFCLVSEKEEILSFVKKSRMKRKGGCPWGLEFTFRAGGDF